MATRSLYELRVLIAGLSFLLRALLAQAMSISVALIRQARLAPDAHSCRSPPQGWEKAAARLAKKQAAGLARLAEQLEKD
jgi:hypothetical protein